MTFMIIQLAVLVVLSGLLGYLLLLSALAAWRKTTMPADATHQHRFVVVIPAHDEQSGIAETIASVLSVDYPQDLRSCVVIADNCTDRTADVAMQAGARVLVRVDGDKKGKGYALRWCFDQLLAGGDAIDAVMVVDADTTVSPNVLSVLNSYLISGATVIQCNDQVMPRPGKWSSESTRIGFLLYNYVRPLGRKHLGCSAGLRGNGMCFRTSVLRRVPWEAYGRAEDLEYGLDLLLQGERVHFAPEATVLAMMPEDARHAVTQRVRWEGGRFPIIRRYAGRLIVEAIRKRSFVLFDAAIDLVTPPLVNLVAVTGLLAAGNGLLFLLGVQLAGPAALIGLSGVLFGVLHVIIGLSAAQADRSVYRSLLFIPRYVLWKIGVYARLPVRGKPTEWIRTTRESRATEGGK